MSADKSFATRNRILESRNLALFNRNNPTTKELGANILDESTYLSRSKGGMPIFVEGMAMSPPANFSITVGGRTYNSALIEIGSSIFPPPYDLYMVQYPLSWNHVDGATHYTVTVTSNDFNIISLVLYTGGTTAIVYLANPMSYTINNAVITVTAFNDWGSSQATILIDQL